MACPKRSPVPPPASWSRLLPRACNGGAGLATACTNLGLAYGAGRGVARNPKMAVQAFTYACNGGDAMGCTQLGIATDQGNGVTANAEEALALFIKACDLGDLDGCCYAAVIYEEGRTGIEADRAQAITFYRRALELDPQNAFALERLAALGDTP